MDLRKVFDQTVRDLKREVNKKVLKVPEIEQKVLDATSNEPWGPHGTAMAELAQSTRNYNDYQMIMTILWKRLADTGKNWRHVYKSLTIFDYFVAHGAERVIDELREHVFQIQGLFDFQYVEPNGKDQGVNVRKKAQSLVALLNDKEKIREVRQKAVANRDKYQGYSSTGGVSKPASYSSTGTRGYSDWDSSRGYSDWDDDKNGRKAREGRYSVEDDSYDDDHKDNDKSHKSKPPYEESQKEYKSLNRKSPGTTAVKSSNSDEDDFDPRATKKPSSTATQAAAPAPEVDFFGQIDFFSTASTVDPFTLNTAPASTPTPAPTVTADMFASADSSDAFGTSSNDFGAFTAAPAAAVSNGEDFFAGNPAFTAAPAATTSNSGDFFAADPFGQLSELQFESKPATKPLENPSSDTSLNAFSGVKASQPASTAQTVPSFQTKSSVWADSLASGLIDLNITAPKSTTALADVGVQSTGLGPDWFREDSQSGFRGNAMGPGNGLGLGGAGGGAPPPSMTGGTNGFGFAGLESKQTKDEPFGFGSPAKAASHHAFFNAGLKS